MRCLPDALLKVARTQDGLFTRRQARAAHVADSTLDGAVGRVVQRVLPSVYAAFTGALTDRQRLRAAVLYGRIDGDETVGILGGLAACHLHKLRTAREFDVVQLLVPRPRKLAAADFVVVRKAARLGQIWQLTGLPVCSPSRAIIDASRRMRTVDQVRALLADGVQSGKATVSELEAELASGGSSGSRLARRVLDEVSDGVHSVAEAHLRVLLRRVHFPPALWNPDIYDTSAHFLGRPDGLWPEASLVVQVESREWHLSPEHWAATMKRASRLSRVGFDVQQIAPSRVRTEPAEVVAELHAAYDGGLARYAAGVRPEVIIRRRDAA